MYLLCRWVFFFYVTYMYMCLKVDERNKECYVEILLNPIKEEECFISIEIGGAIVVNYLCNRCLSPLTL